MANEKIETVESIRKSFSSPQNINKIHRNSLSPLEKLGLMVTERVGTMGFFFIIFLWTAIWLTWNTLGPEKYRFDPAPAFVLWLIISNLIQIHLMPLIMVGQNVQSKHEALRSEHDYETDKKAEKEIETILLHLENQQELILEILQKIERLEKGKNA